MITEFSNKPRPDTCVIICVTNEGERLLNELKKLDQYPHLVDLIIVDKKSLDGSTAKSALTKFHIRCLITYTGPGFLGSQLRLGLQYAKDHNYKYIISLDGNDKDGIDAIPKFIKKLSTGYDFVQGSRFLPGGQYKNTPIDRILAIKFLALPIIRLASNFSYTDPVNGFKGFRSELLSDSRLNLFRPIFSTYNIQYYLTIKAPTLGYAVTEIPVSRNYPPTKTVPTKIKSISAKLAVLKDIISVSLGDCDPSDGFGFFDRYLSNRRQREAINSTRLTPLDIVLDYGCGKYYSLAGKILPQIKMYIGLDKLVTPYKKAKIQLTKVLPTTPRPTKIFCLAVIEHLANPQAVLSQLYKYSSPKTQLILTTPAPPFSDAILHILGFFHIVNKHFFADHKYCYSKKDIAKLLQKSGWTMTHYSKFLFGLNSLIIAQKYPII